MTDEYARTQLDVAAYAARTQAGSCFICRVIDGRQEHEHPIIYRDDTAIAFLNRFPTLAGYVLVAPIAHREEVVGDFSLEEYLRLQAVVYRVGRAISATLPTERLYVLSLGSRQGNAHLHWHLAPLPPGVPYDEQQYHALMVETKGYLAIPDEVQADLAARIGAAVAADTATSPPAEGTFAPTARP